MQLNARPTDSPSSSALRRAASLFLILAMLVSQLFAAIPTYAGGGAYSLKWYGADPDVNAGTYMPTYAKKYPTGAGGLALACPTPSGGAGRAADPMKDAVLYGPA